MTREEAKRILYVFRAVILVDASHIEAFDMAIKALEQEPCEDAISRQAVEDAIAETNVNGESLGYAVAWDILSDLPSVTPQPKTDVLDKIRAEIERHRRKTQGIDPYDLVGDCLDIIDKCRAESEVSE